MARKPRIEFEGAFYHVLTRGNQKQKIFLNEEDFSKYLQILTDYKKRYRFLLYAYVLMPNHVHLLMETREISLSKILQGINQRYTMYFNWKYDTVGHLFQGRYKAILCDKNEYLLNLIKYIHYNPVRAELAGSLDQYLWSSHRNYMRMKSSGIVDKQLVFDIFSENQGRARKLYRKFMEEGAVLSEKDLDKTVDQRILGGEGFAEGVMRQTENKTALGKAKGKFALEEIAEKVQGICKIDLNELRGNGKSKEVMNAKKSLSLIAIEYGYRGKEIAEFLQKDPAAITRYLRNLKGVHEAVANVISLLENS